MNVFLLANKICELFLFVKITVEVVSSAICDELDHRPRRRIAIDKWPSGFVYGVQLGVGQTQAMIKTKRKIKKLKKNQRKITYEIKKKHK